jgi:hypothetical protein
LTAADHSVPELTLRAIGTERQEFADTVTACSICPRRYSTYAGSSVEDSTASVTFPERTSSSSARTTSDASVGTTWRAMPGLLAERALVMRGL